jgi:hypothetical protein
MSSFLHIDHEIVEYVAAEEPEYEGIVEVYEEEVPCRKEPQSRQPLTLLHTRMPKASPGA